MFLSYLQPGLPNVFLPPSLFPLPYPPPYPPSPHSFPNHSIHTALLEFVLNDLKGHFDLAVAWLYAEYSIAEGYLHSAQNNLQYDSCLTGLLRGAKAKLDTRDRLTDLTVTSSLLARLTGAWV